MTRIYQTTWLDEERRWNLQGMARAMYEWLGDFVEGSEQFKGWELAGTLNPDNPDPANFQPPPKWMTPEIMMRALCAWYAGGMQDYLFSNGLIPLVRAEIDSAGRLIRVAGANVPVTTALMVGGDPGNPEYYYHILLDNENNPHPLSDFATISVTATTKDVETPLFSTVRARWTNPPEDVKFPPNRPDQYDGWIYVFDEMKKGSVYVHIFA